MPPKKTSGADGLKQLKDDLKQKKPANLYIFYGTEDYLRDYYLEKLKKLVLSGGFEEFNYHVFQGEDLDIHTLVENVEAMPMMSERSMVLVQDFDLFKNEARRDALLELFQDLPDYVCLLFLYDTMEWSSNGNTKLGKLLKEKARIVEFTQQEQSDLTAWVKRRLRSGWEKEIDNAAAEYLTFLCGGLMTNLSGEIDKLGAYTKGSQVTKKEIDAVCDPVLDAKAFQMTDAVGAGDYNKAMELLGELCRMGEEPIYILGAMGRQVRQIWSARAAIDRGRPESYVAQLWNMKAGWQSKKLMQNARNYSAKWCRKAVKLMQQADYDMKMGGRDKEEVLIDLLLTLSAAGKEGRR